MVVEQSFRIVDVLLSLSLSGLFETNDSENSRIRHQERADFTPDAEALMKRRNFAKRR